MGTYNSSQTVPTGGDYYVAVDSEPIGVFFSLSIICVSFRTQPCTNVSSKFIPAGMVPGSQNLAPITTVSGCPTQLDVTLTVAAPQAPSVLLIGAPGSGAPLFGGTIWPTVPLVAFGRVTNNGPGGFGGWAVSLPISLGLTGRVFMQTVVADSFAVQGFVISNAVDVMLN